MSPHTGFASAVLAVGTPWLTIPGGRWFEYFFNRVPRRSVIPDTDRYPCIALLGPLSVIEDGPDGPRAPSMFRARTSTTSTPSWPRPSRWFEDRVTCEQALSDYFADLLRAHRGDPSPIWVDRRGSRRLHPGP